MKRPPENDRLPLVKRRIQTRAISIQRFPYSESSQVSHFLTEDHGRVGVLARGAYREKNSYQGPIDLLVRGQIKVTVMDGRGLGLLTARQVESAYPVLRQCLPRFSAASHLLRLIVKTIPVGEGSTESFLLFDRALQTLETIPLERIPLLLLSFDVRFLKQMGFAPELRLCVRCTSRPGGAYVAAEGGVICGNCRQSAGEGLTLTKPARELFRQLEARKLQDVEAAPGFVIRRCRQVLDQHLVYHLDCSLDEDWSLGGVGMERRRRRG